MEEIKLLNKNGKILASSREVAEKFGKRNSEVNRSIANLTVQNCTVKNMYVESTYISSRGREEVEYLMDRDGFSLLVMGFTGKKALEWKLKYIEAFNTMEERLKSNIQLTEEEKLKLQLFSKDPVEVAAAHNRLVELETAPLIAENKEMRPKAVYHDEVLNKKDLLTTTVVAKDLGLNAIQLHNIMKKNRIIYKTGSGVWVPYNDYQWLISQGYADYTSYPELQSLPCLKWTEKGRKWIIEHFDSWNK